MRGLLQFPLPSNWVFVQELLPLTFKQVRMVHTNSSLDLQSSLSSIVVIYIDHWLALPAFEQCYPLSSFVCLARLQWYSPLSLPLSAAGGVRVTASLLSALLSIALTSLGASARTCVQGMGLLPQTHGQSVWGVG